MTLTKKRVLIVSIVALVLAGGYGSYRYIVRGEESFQRNADILRARHLKYYAELIEEYKGRTGSYPLMEGADVPVYVFIATRRQLPEGHPEQTLPFEHRIGSLKRFFEILELGLQREVPEYYDPQIVASGRPNFYMYVADRGTYFLAVHFSNEMPFTKKLGENYYKVDVSNNPTEANQARSPSDLIARREFQELISRPLEGAGFWEEREAETRSDSDGR